MATTSEDVLKATSDIKHEVGTMPSQPSGGKGKKPGRWRWFALIGLIVLVGGGLAAFLIPYLHTTLTASAATVTLTPAQQHISTDYVVTAVTGTPDASQNQVSARLLSSTLKESVTVKATGKGHQDATYAKGKLSIRPIMGTLSVGFYSLTGGDLKVDIGFNVKTPLTYDTTVDAQALKTGPVGNISAYGEGVS